MRHGLVSLLAIAVAGGCFTVPAAAGPIGFASLEGGTPGGDPAKVCVVRKADEDSLRAAVGCARQGAKGGIVTFADGSHPITVERRIDLPSNITVKGPAIIQTKAAGIFIITGSKNVVVTDIVFRTLAGGESKKGKPCPDPTAPNTTAVGNDERLGTTACTVPLTIMGTRNKKGEAPPEVYDSRNVWIDHNTFERCGDKCIVVKNGAKKPSGQFSGADNVTISNNRFEKSFFGVLIALMHNQKGGARYLVMRDTAKCERTYAGGQLPRMRVTLYGNLFDQVRRRMARVAYCSSYAHEFNNAIVGFGLPLSRYPKGTICGTHGSAYGFGPSAHSGGKLLLENNYIAAWPNDPNGCKAAVQTSEGPKGGDADDGFVRESGNLYVNGAFGASNKPGAVPSPPYPYKAIPASQVLDNVKQNAGARMK